MKEELRDIAKGIKQFLRNTQEDDLILKAALKQKKAAFTSEQNNGVSLQQASRPSYVSQTLQMTAYKADKKTKTFLYQKSLNERADMKENQTDILPQQAAFNKAEKMAQIAEIINTCQRCELGKTRIKAVPGEGNINAEIMFVGEGPGYDEDRQGRPFVGRAGQLLDKIITAMGFSRQEVFIANIVKCHPMVDPSRPDKHSNDRPPNSNEIAVCRRYLEQQIETVSPKYIIALGKIATQTLISETTPAAELRGKIYDLKLSCLELDMPIKIMATYHPSALLRNPSWKKEAWTHLKGLLADMGRKPAAK